MGRFIVVLVFIFMLAGCSGGLPSWLQDISGGTIDENGEQIQCTSIPERNVKRCEYIKDGRTSFIEVPLNKEEEVK